MVSGSISLPSRGSFHLSLTVLCAIGHLEYLALGGGPPSFPQGRLSRGTLVPTSALSPFDYGAFTLFGRPFQVRSPRVLTHLSVGPNPYRLSGRFGLLPFRSPLLRESLLLSFPRATKMFQFARFPSADYGFISGCLGITPNGFPHSEIPGSLPACGSPGRFAACRVLLRLQVPMASTMRPYLS